MGLPKDIIDSESGLGPWCVLAGWRGSLAHGMFIPSKDPTSIDDKDTMHVCIPPQEYYFGLKEYGSRGTKEIKRGEWDVVIYEFKKFIGLLLNGNPNVLSLLWIDETHYLKRTSVGNSLIANRNLFVGRHVYHSFVGYAHSQLKRMTHLAFEGYMGDKRKKLVLQHGYDTKNAAHLIRLLRMGIEFLKDGQMYVHRHDAQQLLQIKRGEWKLEDVQAEAERLFKVAEQTYLDSTLPVKPDRDFISRQCDGWISEHLKSQKELEPVC